MAGRGQTYTKEFKDSAVQLALNSEKSAMSITKDLGMSEKTLYVWLSNYRKKHYLIPNVPNPPKNSSPKESLEITMILT